MKITMIPKEKFDRNIWYALQKIKEKSLYTKEGKPTSYIGSYLIL